MHHDINTFKKTKDFLICIDSDGCAIDSMTIKHSKCFAVAFAEEFGNAENTAYIIDEWKHINLYSQNRGLNRFKGAMMLLEKIQDSLSNSSGLTEYIEWAHNTKVLSNTELQKHYEETNNPFIQRILNWSFNVNKKILSLPPEQKPAFDGVMSTLDYAQKYADIAVVSSANAEAVISEWTNANIIKYARIFLTQESGKKVKSIEALLKYGYKNQNAVMIGDAISDLDAAKNNNILFYPVIAKEEVKSWKEFNNHFLPLFLKNKYTPEIETELITKMKNNLN